MDNSSAESLWAAYQKGKQTGSDTYEAWAFGDSPEMADELALLVKEGKKTATASNYALYEIEEELLPEPGLINVILDGKGEAAAIVETTDVEIVPFNQVSEEHAFREGEGDRSIEYWRSVHEPFFKRELEAAGRVFSGDMLVVCERFKVVFTA